MQCSMWFCCSDLEPFCCTFYNIQFTKPNWLFIWLFGCLVAEFGCLKITYLTQNCWKTDSFQMHSLNWWNSNWYQTHLSLIHDRFLQLKLLRQFSQHISVLVDDGWLDTKSRLWTPKSRLCPTFVQCLSIVCPKSTKIQGLSRLWTPKSKVCPDSGLPSPRSV